MHRAIAVLAASAIVAVIPLAQANAATDTVHKLTGTILHSVTNSGLPLPENTWTVVDTAKVNCKNTQGCTYGFGTMVEMNCVIENTITIGSSVDGVLSPNQPSTSNVGSPVMQNYRNSITASFGKHSLQVQVYIAPDRGLGDPQCTLNEFEVDYNEYTP